METPTISIDLNQLDSISIGRKKSNDIVIKDKNISGEHCRLFKNGTDWFVEDTNSTNGTFLDDVRIDSTTVFSNGSKLQLMDYCFTLEDGVLNVYGNPEVISKKKKKVKNQVLILQREIKHLRLHHIHIFIHHPVL